MLETSDIYLITEVLCTLGLTVYVALYYIACSYEIPFLLHDTEASNSGILLPSVLVSLLVFALLMFVTGLLLGLLLMKQCILKSLKNDVKPASGSVPLYKELQPPSAARPIGQEFIKTTSNEAYGTYAP